MGGKNRPEHSAAHGEHHAEQAPSGTWLSQLSRRYPAGKNLQPRASGTGRTQGTGTQSDHLQKHQVNDGQGARHRDHIRTTCISCQHLSRQHQRRKLLCYRTLRNNCPPSSCMGWQRLLRCRSGHRCPPKWTLPHGCCYSSSTKRACAKSTSSPRYCVRPGICQQRCRIILKKIIRLCPGSESLPG